MSISELNSNETIIEDAIYDQFESKLSALRGKIQDLMRKIIDANKELMEIRKELKKLNIGVIEEKQPLSSPKGIVNTCFSMLDKACNKVRAAVYNPEITQFLHSQKQYELEREHYHRLLAENEKEYEKCEQDFQKYKGNIALSYQSQYEALVKKSGVEPNNQRIMTKQTHLVALSEILPFERGLDSEFMKMQERTQPLFARAMSSTAIKDLYIEAVLTPNPYLQNRTGSWAVIFNTKEANPDVRFGAYCSSRDRFIAIDTTVSDDEALMLFVFELTNVISIGIHYKIDQLAKDGKIGREEYAKCTEYVEYQGCLRHREIINAAIKEQGWSKSLDGYEGISESFESHWAQIKNSKHTEYYRIQWDKKYSNLH